MERIEHYEDFRAYLRDFYDDRKKRSPYFSYRTFARKAGLTSPSHFKEVVDGTRKLTAKTIGIDLEDREQWFREHPNC